MKAYEQILMLSKWRFKIQKQFFMWSDIYV